MHYCQIQTLRSRFELSCPSVIHSIYDSVLTNTGLWNACIMPLIGITKTCCTVQNAYK